MPPPPPSDLPSSISATTSSTTKPHPSLPARPPPSASLGLPSKVVSANHTLSTAGAAGKTSRNDVQSRSGRGGPTAAFAGFRPRSLGPPAAARWQAQPSAPVQNSMNYPQANYSGHSSSGMEYRQTGQDSHLSVGQIPQIQNPFPLPGQQASGGRGAGGAYDPEMEAQIAQWQSAYAPADDPASKGAGRGRPDVQTFGANNQFGYGAPSAAPEPVAEKGGANSQNQTVMRSGGGQTWQDSTLLEWDPAHFRLFIGNLAGEVTDESLLKAFSRYTSVTKARVIREKRTKKSKGYGFVSFSDGDQYFLAAKEMQGKYIGNHPVQIKRSTTEIKAVNPGDKRRNGKGHHSGQGSKGNASTGAGVTKKQTKTKGGLRILG